MRLFSNKKSQSTRTLGQRRSLTHQTYAPKNYFYHSNRSEVIEKPTKRQTLRNPLRPQTVSRVAAFSLQRFGLLIVIIVTGISLINVLAVSSNTRVVLLDQGQIGYLHTAAEYQQASKTLFSKSFVNNNKITINTASISSNLIEEFPELATVTIKLPLVGSEPIIYLSPNKVLVGLTTSSGTYAVDASGQVVGNINSTGFAVLHLIDIQDQSTKPIHNGQSVLSAETITFIQTVLFQVEQKHLVISKLVMPAGASELDMYLAGQGYFVKFNLDDPEPLQEVGTFLAVQHYLLGQSITPAQYIDVRVDGRAYYK